jgi:hypothetical protein
MKTAATAPVISALLTAAYVAVQEAFVRVGSSPVDDRMFSIIARDRPGSRRHAVGGARSDRVRRIRGRAGPEPGAARSRGRRSSSRLALHFSVSRV